jgi:hypothetical protein
MDLAQFCIRQVLTGQPAGQRFQRPDHLKQVPYIFLRKLDHTRAAVGQDFH